MMIGQWKLHYYRDEEGFPTKTGSKKENYVQADQKFSYMRKKGGKRVSGRGQKRGGVREA